VIRNSREPGYVGTKIVLVTSVSREGIDTKVVPEDALEGSADEYVEKLYEEELDSGLPIEISTHYLPSSVVDSFITGKAEDEWAHAELKRYCLTLAGGVATVSKRLRHRMVFITWNSKQVELLTPSGMLKNPSPVPPEYRREELLRDMLVVNEAMGPDQLLEVSYLGEHGIELLRCKGGEFEKRVLH